MKAYLIKQSEKIMKSTYGENFNEVEFQKVVSLIENENDIYKCEQIVINLTR